MKKSIGRLCMIPLAALLVSCGTTTVPMVAKTDQALYSQAVQAIQDGRFVLQGDLLEFRRGGSVNVFNNTNFISVDGDLVTIQTAFNNGLQGANNLGGITLEGKPNNVKITMDKRGNLSYSARVWGALISAQIEMTVFAHSNEATATVLPSFSGNRITLNGVVVPADEARIFKGSTFP